MLAADGVNEYSRKHFDVLHHAYDRVQKAQAMAERDARIVAAFKSGLTLAEVGAMVEPPISRERVRQILVKAGIDTVEGGSRIRSFVRKSHKRRTTTPHGETWSPVYGCSYNDARLINGEHNLSKRGCIAQVFWTFRHNCIQHGIEWDMTFPQWWKIWCDSGHWDKRGIGRGYLMLRIGGCGPVSPDNVEVRRNDHAQSERMKGNRNRYKNQRGKEC